MQKLTEILLYMQRYTSSKRKVTLNMLAEELHVAPSTIIKLAKKIGYSGFTDMNYQMRNEAEKQDTFERELIEGNLQEVIDDLVNLLIEHEHHKNLVIIPGESNYLEKYISRKLGMFDIFATDTYDYSMIVNPRLEKGIAFVVNNSRELGDYELINQTKQCGYYVVILTNERSQTISNYADMEIVFKTTKYKTADFFGAKVIIFVEKLLSEFAKRIMEEREEIDDERN